MSNAALPEEGPRAVPRIRRVDKVCDAFEEAWQQANATAPQPRIEDYLDQVAVPDRPLLLHELLGLELDYRRRRAEQPDLQEYLVRFPAHAERIRALFQETRLSGGPAAESAGRAALATADPDGVTETGGGPLRPAIPGYEILDQLGEGGMGIVYRARQVRLGRLVALKMIAPAGGAGSQEALARFTLEAEAVGRLKHPHIVQIYEQGEHEGRPYFSMELVEGGSLQQRIAGAAQPPRAAAALLEVLAAAVHAVHQQGIIHRDLKPANVLLTTDGTPKISDFGLAKLVTGGPDRTGSHARLGTPRYMAPEQAVGKAREATSATDVYALGAILYAMLAGRPPFEGESVQVVLDQVVHTEPVPPSRLQPAVPRDLEIICLKCLEKEPRRRYASAAQLAQRLRLFLDGKPIPDRSPGAWERLVKWARRRPAVAGLVGVSVAALLSLLMVILWSNVRLHQEVRHAVLQASVQDLVLNGQQALAEKNWTNARALLDKAWARLESAPGLDDLKRKVQDLRDQVKTELATQRTRAAAVGRYKRFFRFRHDTLDHFYGRQFNPVKLLIRLEPGTVPVRRVLDPLREAVQRTRTLRLDPHLTRAQKQAVAEGGSELVLILAGILALDRGAGVAGQDRLDLAAALDLLEQAAQLNTELSRSPAYQRRRASFLAQLGQQGEASTARQRADRLAPASAIDFFVAGVERCHRDFERAARGLDTEQRGLERTLQDFDRALRKQPGHFWARYFLACSQLRAQRLEEAIDNFTDCLEQEPGLVAAHLGRGLACGQRNLLKRAREDFDRVLQLSPQADVKYLAHIARGLVRFQRARLKDAAEEFTRAIRLKPGRYLAYFDLGQVYLKQQRLDQAAKQFEQVLGLKPPVLFLADSHASLGFIWHLRARSRAEPDKRALEQKAVAECDQALTLLPGQTLLAHRVRAEALLELQRFGEAIVSYDAYLKQGGLPGDSLRDVYVGRGRARMGSGQYQGALNDYAQALNLDARPNAELHGHRGWAYYFAGAFKLALADFDACLQLEPTRSDAFNGRGNCLVMLGQYREAVADAEKAYALKPTTPEMMHNLACIFAQAAAQAAGKARTDKKQARNAVLARSYTERALTTIRRTLALVPREEREAFWRDKIQKDDALDPIRHTPEFIQLKQELEKEFARPRK